MGLQQARLKHKVAADLKISIRMAAKALKTLAAAGYLRENSKLYTYELYKKRPANCFQLDDLLRELEDKIVKEDVQSAFKIEEITETVRNIGEILRKLKK